MKNHIFVIEWKVSARKWVAIDYECKEIEANRIMKNYQELNTKNKYRTRKYTSE